MQPDTASDVLRLAGEIVQREEFPAELFRVMGGHRFLEVAPRLANKGTTLRYLLNEQPLEGALPVYIGDDDKDEEAFAVIQEVSGVAIKVETRQTDSMAPIVLKSPHAVRQFLTWLL
jgi:trehalose-phosphatase